ncbi:hypothetical protein [Neisseria mucosa]|uniref:hypothetical protein n=1 Tax=Neisseria mucosa TaxID=488 RepID=UPI00051D0663|nr:hypothetical protein [Neisseria mucosa]KGJ31707.1 hypothetical protein ES17_06235 [Neisseria mucosa]
MSDYYFSLSTVKAYVSGTFVSHAVKKANEYGGFAGEDDRDPHNNSYDAYRHALLSAVMTQNIQQVAEGILISDSGIAYPVSQDQFHELSKVIGRDQAKAILDDHEDISNKPANMSMEDWQKEVNMDKWNNAVGQKEYFKWEQAIIKGETKDPLEKWIYDAVKRGETINNLDDNRVFTEEMKLSFKNEQEQLLQYSQSFFVSKLQSLAPETQNLFNAVKGHLTEYHEKNGIPIEEAKLQNSAMALTALGYSKKMTDVTLFNVKDGQYLIGERNPVLNRVSMDMQTAAYIPIEESLAKVQEATQRFEYEEQQRQYAQSQAQGMSRS